MDPVEEQVLQIAWYLARADRENKALVVVLNLSTKIRRAIVDRCEFVDNEPLHRHLKNALGRQKFITTAFRAKFLPYGAFIAYIQEKIEEKDYRPLKLYFERTKSDSSLPKLKICLPCAKKRFISQELKMYISAQSPCDLELYQEEEQQTQATEQQSAKRRLIDVAVGPDDPRFDRDWIRETNVPQAPIPVVENEQAQPELTEEQKQEQLVRVLTRKDNPPPADFNDFLGFSMLRMSMIRRFQRN